MDFWYNFQIQRNKLGDISEIQNICNEHGQIQIDQELLDKFHNHLPLIPEEFWQTEVNNIQEYKRRDNIQLDEELMDYIFAVISWYTDTDLPHFELTDLDITSLLASQFYFHLLDVTKVERHRSYIYKNAFLCLEKYCRKNRKSVQCLNFLKAFRHFLSHNELKIEYLEATLVPLCKIIETTSTKVYSQFDIENTKDSADEALRCLNLIARQNWSSKARFIVNYALLSGIRCEHDRDIAKRNFLNLILEMKPSLKETDFENFQQTFLYMVMKVHSFDATEAARLISTFDEEFCKDTIFKLLKMGISKEVSHKNNLLKLFARLLEHLPTNFYETQKLDVFIQSLLNVCVINCINNDEAINLVSKICLLNKDIISKQFKILLNTPTEYIYVENSLPTFCLKFNMHWLNRTKNRNIAVIIIRILCNTYNITLDERYAGIITMISSEADPSDLKMCIPLLLRLYMISKENASIYVAQKILESMYSMAIHPSAGSSEFVKVLFNAILEPTEDIRPHKEDFISSLSSQIMKDNKVFINRAHELNLLECNNKKLINKIMNGDYDALRLTCAVFEKITSPEGEKLIYHIMANPALLCQAEYTGDLLFIIHTGLKYFITCHRRINLTSIQTNNLKDFAKILWEYMLKFSLPYNALGIGLDVLKLLFDLTGESINLDNLFSHVNFEMKNALSKLPEDTYMMPIMYSTELIGKTDYTLPEGIYHYLDKTLNKFLEASKRQENLRNEKLHARHYYCLTLMVRIAMQHSRFGAKAMKSLKTILDISDEGFKISLMDLMYDLCTYVVHNFDEFLQYSFNDLKSLNVSNRKQAATHIEHFIRLDYLKLSVEQYCKFIALIGDPFIERSIKNLLTNFVVTNQSIIEKYFLSMIMHFNFYSVHPICPMSPQYMRDMNCIIRANFNKWNVYSILFRSLPLRSRFLILKDICVSFFDKFMRGKMKIEDGIWNVLIDSINLFKIMAYNSLENVKYERFYEKEMEEIRKYIIEKKTMPSEVPLTYPELKDVIEYTTYSLLQLLFYTENEMILKNYKLKLFEAILFWTHDLRPDIASICNTGKEKTASKITNYYLKLTLFYKNHKQCLNSAEYISEFNEVNNFNLH